VGFFFAVWSFSINVQCLGRCVYLSLTFLTFKVGTVYSFPSPLLFSIVWKICLFPVAVLFCLGVLRFFFKGGVGHDFVFLQSGLLKFHDYSALLSLRIMCIIFGFPFKLRAACIAKHGRGPETNLYRTKGKIKSWIQCVLISIVVSTTNAGRIFVPGDPSTIQTDSASILWLGTISVAAIE
jgi:hypothetical protein